MAASVPVTVPNVVASAGSRSTAASEPRDGTATTAGFDSELYAARQQNAAKSGGDASGKPDDRSCTPAAWSPLGQQRNATQTVDPGVVPAALPSATPSTVQMAETVVAATGAPADESVLDDQLASVAAGAMLALLGPSVAGVLQPADRNAGAATGALVQANKTVATDARAATLLQFGAAGSPAATPANTVPVAANMLAVPNAALSASTATDKDSSDGRGLAVTLSAPPAATAAPTVPHQLQLQSPLRSHAFTQDLGQQVAWLGGQDIKQARIRLHPEELGSLDVNVKVMHGRVDVVFSVQHPAAASAVQQSLPQLDQMLARHGLSLGHAEVGQHDRGDRRGHAGDAGTAMVDEIGDVHGGLPVSPGKVGLLDAFA